jgi:hypothetical protein
MPFERAMTLTTNAGEVDLLRRRLADLRP